jgi:hypothetical protein
MRIYAGKVLRHRGIQVYYTTIVDTVNVQGSNNEYMKILAYILGR